MQDLLGEWREGLRGEGAIPVIPAVDVLGAGAVRLRRGAYDEVVVRAGDPVALARSFAEAGAGRVHFVDLDGARSGRVRPELVRSVAEAVAPALLQASGGIRGPDDARALLEAGADREVRTAGWTASSGLAVEEAAGRCALAGVVRVLVTAIDRDGTLAGPDLELVRLVAATGLRVLAAGGIRSPGDVAALAAAGAEAAVVGRALLATGR